MLVLAVAALALTPTYDLTFVRHGETQANASGKYNGQTLNAFSAKGQAEVNALTKRLLKERPFDRIYVSPSPRAMKTILPYLKATHKKAIIWPLLYECCTGKRPVGAHATHFAWGAKIQLGSMAPYFRIMGSETRLPVSPGYNEGLAQVEESVREFKSLGMGRILLVGHSGHGGQFLHELTGKWRKVENAKEIQVQLNS
jgi:broad specificity phosphatase PhoE